MLHAYIGDGKGKTTAGIGQLIRALGAGKRVYAVFFDKSDRTHPIHEAVVLERLQVKVSVMGCDRSLPDGGFRMSLGDDDKLAARGALSLARNLIGSGDYDLILLDEIVTSLSSGALGFDDFVLVLDAVTEHLDLICTGRCSNDDWLSRFDLVSRITKVKHYFDRGFAARPGIEY